MRGTLQERFWAKVNKDGPIPEHRPDLGKCWLWTGTRKPDGYAEIMSNHSIHNYVHRISYIWAKGEIPEGLELDHLCRTRHCVNPNHLEAVTALVNWQRGTSPFAENSRKTECPKGHPYDERNTYVRKGSNWRGCRICRTEARRRCDDRKRKERPPNTASRVYADQPNRGNRSFKVDR